MLVGERLFREEKERLEQDSERKKEKKSAQLGGQVPMSVCSLTVTSGLLVVVGSLPNHFMMWFGIPPCDGGSNCFD